MNRQSSILNRHWTAAALLLCGSALAGRPAVRFEQVQPELFAAAGAQPNAWADYDGDGDLDLFVGFAQDKPNRLYRNDKGTFVDVAAEAGVADLTDTRAAAWGDFDGDGDPDLFVGFTRRSNVPHKLYRNNGSDSRSPTSRAVGVEVIGELAPAVIR